MSLDCLNIPVFVFPSSVKFVLEDRSSHKQVLSIVNPYEYPIRFQILSTAPDKYEVNTAEGVISSQHKADIVVRLRDANISNCDIPDKFRIQVLDKVNRRIIGKQDISAVLSRQICDPRNSIFDGDDFQTLPLVQNLSGHGTPVPDTADIQPHQVVSNSPTYVILSILFVCVSGLLLPSEKVCETQDHFHVSQSLKIIFAFVLGLVTFKILKSY